MTSQNGPSNDKARLEVDKNSTTAATDGTTPRTQPRPAQELSYPNTPTLKLSDRAARPQLSSRPTTALSLADVHTRTAESASPSKAPSRIVSRKASRSHLGHLGSDYDDSTSLRSYIPTLEAGIDDISIFDGETSSAWAALKAQSEGELPFSHIDAEDESIIDDIVHEFDEVVPAIGSAAVSDNLERWRLKLKHFFILSASGKPIYSRHGDDQTISHHIGVVQTIVASFQANTDAIRGFVAGDTRFVIMTRGPLTLVAISRLFESERQLQNQLESLYMQILSTLTLPSLEKMFSARPSTDLRRPLQGTDVLLDGLADGFTRGSPSTLLTALECLRMRKTHRRVINDTFLKVRSPDLVYGLIVAAGRLVSVVRPKKHSLHPGDLHLIFNMLFEAEGVKAGGGENWIPLCLPGFNNTGYVYMYVSFLSATQVEDDDVFATSDDEVAVVLISANKESFFELQKMRNQLIEQLRKNGSMTIIQHAIAKGRASCADIVSGTVLSHFLYKSRGNVQFTMPSFKPNFASLVARRKLMSLYHILQDGIHSRASHLRVQHCVSHDASALAWETPMFELYCVAGPHVSRADICQGANKVIQWVRREEERIFIIGGAVF